MYLDVILDQLHITDADALLLPDQKKRSNKKEQRFNVPAQDPSIERFRQSTAGSAAAADNQASIVPPQWSYSPAWCVRNVLRDSCTSKFTMVYLGNAACVSAERC